MFLCLCKKTSFSSEAQKMIYININLTLKTNDPNIPKAYYVSCSFYSFYTGCPVISGQT